MMTTKHLAQHSAHGQHSKNNTFIIKGASNEIEMVSEVFGNLSNYGRQNKTQKWSLI